MARIQTVRDVVRLSRTEDLVFKAAGIAFYAVTSLIPLLVIALAVLSAVDAASVLVDAIRSSVSGTVADLVDTTLNRTQVHGIAGGLGLFVTLWSATKIFRGLTVAVGGLYPQTVERSFVERSIESVVVFAIILLAAGVLSVSGVALAYIPYEIPYTRVVGRVVAVVALVVGLLPVFYVLPPTEMTVGRALPGAVLTAIGWVILQVAFAFSLRNATSFAAYGVLGVVVLFITFLYFAAIVLLVGTALNVAIDADGRPRGVHDTSFAGPVTGSDVVSSENETEQ